MYKIVCRTNSQVDISLIYYYIKYKLENIIVANNITEGILNKIESLQYLPYRGAIYSNYFNRFLIQKNFLIFYEIQEKEKLIIIKRIIHKNINNENIY